MYITIASSASQNSSTVNCMSSMISPPDVVADQRELSPLGAAANAEAGAGDIVEYLDAAD